VSWTWREYAAAGGGALALGAGGYALYKYLQPRIAHAQSIPAPALTLVSVQAVSPKYAHLTVEAQLPSKAASAPNAVVRWYHFYPLKGQLYPHLVGQTLAGGLAARFTYGLVTSGPHLDVVTPGQPYTLGAQVCVGTACSKISRLRVQVPAYHRG
jgi:hypothetical protein